MALLDPWSYAKAYPNEHGQQVALFMWANMACRFGFKAANEPTSYTQAGIANGLLKFHGDTIVKLKWLHAVHNQGHGDKIRGGKAKAEGVKAGVSDLFLPVPTYKGGFDMAGDRLWFHGLYLELKVGNNKPSEKQLDFMADMRQAGYAVEVAYGFEEAKAKICSYLGI